MKYHKVTKHVNLFTTANSTRSSWFQQFKSHRMPEPSFWQYLSGQVPEEEIRTWPTECSLPAFHEVHDLLEPQGGVIPLYIYFLLFLCQTFPVFMARRLYTWWRGSASSEKKRNATDAGSGKRTFIAWFQVIMAVSAWQFQICVVYTVYLPLLWWLVFGKPPQQ